MAAVFLGCGMYGMLEDMHLSDLSEFLSVASAVVQRLMRAELCGSWTSLLYVPYFGHVKPKYCLSCVDDSGKLSAGCCSCTFLDWLLRFPVLHPSDCFASGLHLQLRRVTSVHAGNNVSAFLLCSNQELP